MSLHRVKLSMMVLLMYLVIGCSNNTAETDAVLSRQLDKNAKAHGIPAQALMVMHNREVL